MRQSSVRMSLSSSSMPLFKASRYSGWRPSVEPASSFSSSTEHGAVALTLVVLPLKVQSMENDLSLRSLLVSPPPPCWATSICNSKKPWRSASDNNQVVGDVERVADNLARASANFARISGIQRWGYPTLGTHDNTFRKPSNITQHDFL